MSHEDRGARIVAVICAAAIWLTASPAPAYISGITTESFGPAGCNTAGCHSGGTAPTVTVNGPTRVAPLSTHEYRLDIATVGRQTKGGLNVSAGLGDLAIGGSLSDKTQAVSGTAGRTEITHTMPKAAVDGATSFSFLWTAPSFSTSVRLNGWGNAVNGNNRSSGDRATLARLQIQVATDATATPTGTPEPLPSVTATPTDLTPTFTSTAAPTATETPPTDATPTETPLTDATPTASATPGLRSCVGDCDRSGQVTVDELLSMVDIALDNTPISQCEAGDRNADGHITVDEILGGVNNALVGCPAAADP